MNDFSIHEKYMQRCIELAKQGIGNTAPNPMVGSVIVYKGVIIGEGFHRKFGEAHAEVNAIKSVQDKSLFKESTIYVNLEPCSHYGKTPPCANLITDIGIPNVVIGSIDTASHVSGKGIEILKKSDTNVISGVLENEARELNKRFFTFHEKKRPYIILKWAQTKDGFIDIERKADHPVEPTWITNEYAKTLVHKWRAEEQAILIGANTAINDNPSLTTRNWKGKNPLRIVLDKDLSLAPDLKIFDKSAETIIISDNQAKYLKNRMVNDNIGIEFVDYSYNLHAQIFEILVKKQIQSVIIEGGAKTLNYFIQNNIWDEARIFTGNKEFNKGINAPIILKEILKNGVFGDSKLTLVKN